MPFRPKTRYELKDLAFKRISKMYADCIESFKSFQEDLVGYIEEDALHSQDLCIANTFLVFDRYNLASFRQKKENLVLLGYVSILADSLRLDSELRVHFRDKGIHYNSLPALKIGRLCVDDKYRGSGIGKCMMDWVTKRAYFLNQSIACRFITLDAKRNQNRNKDSYNFYKKCSFQVLKTRNRTELEIEQQKSGQTPMYFDIHPIMQKLKEEKI